MSCEDQYILNNPARITIYIATAAGVLTDPSALRVEYRKPSDTETRLLVYGTDAEIVRDGVGSFHLDLPNDEAGRWKGHWESDGVEAAGEFEYRVKAKNV